MKDEREYRHSLKSANLGNKISLFIYQTSEKALFQDSERTSENEDSQTLGDLSLNTVEEKLIETQGRNNYKGMSKIEEEDSRLEEEVNKMYEEDMEKIKDSIRSQNRATGLAVKELNPVDLDE